jgi:Nuclease-related domain
VARPVQRWIEVTPSQFTHEIEGLNLIRSLLPANAPFRAWSNFEFRDGHGKWHEVDLLVLGQRRLHLVELKYYTGTLRGDDLTWRRDGHRAEDSPLKLTRRKAQRLASKLQDELIRWAQETGAAIPDVRTVVPFVQESVFLHHPGIRCLLARFPDRPVRPGRQREQHRPAWHLPATTGAGHAPAVCRREPRRDHRRADEADRNRPAPAA